MRSNRRSGVRQHGRNDGSFWLSFSDLMSSLVLIIILVMFYIIYQYFNLAEINQAEIARRQYQLDAAQAELETQQGKLSEAEQQMIAQQILLDAKQEELDSAQAVLEAQQTQLADTQAQLSAREEEIAAQQAQMDALGIQLDEQQAQISAQQAQLDNQQAQIEELVGMKTRIITSLSDALRSNNISATVDLTNGSIALESDVMFESGKYELTEAGKRFIDEFLPVYLEVLFSDNYRGYVSEIIIEGHTDSVGGYLPNLELSQQRALAVASYVLGDECRSVSPDMKNELRMVVTVNGRSYSDRVFNADGTEDMDASRRVVFKFRLTDEQMIQQMRQILEENQ